MSSQSFKALRAEIENVSHSLYEYGPQFHELIAEERRKLGRSLNSAMSRSEMLRCILKERCMIPSRDGRLYGNILELVSPFPEGQQSFLLRLLMAISPPKDSRLSKTLLTRFRQVKLVETYVRLEEACMETICPNKKRSLALDQLVLEIHREKEQTSVARKTVRTRLNQGRNWHIISKKLSLEAVAWIPPSRRDASAAYVVNDTEYAPSFIPQVLSHALPNRKVGFSGWLIQQSKLLSSFRVDFHCSASEKTRPVKSKSGTTEFPSRSATGVSI